MYKPTKVDEFILRAEDIIKNNDKDKAFVIISSEIDTCELRYLNEYITPLNFIRKEKVLDWIEASAQLITDVSNSWGHLAASSYFSWARADKWLTGGRPLSLIALDAISYCTTIGGRSNQSPWMREIQPVLTDSPEPATIAKQLKEYLKTDSVPRTKRVVNQIIENIFDAGGSIQ